MAQSIFEAAGGADAMTRIADAWHRRVMADPVVSHAFHGGAKPDHVDRLAAYLGEALGGPARYSTMYGDHATVVRMHSGNGEHQEMNDRAVQLFDAALADAGVAGTARVAMRDYFAWATNGPMYGFHRAADDVPTDLPMPHWNWDATVSYQEQR